MGQEHSRTYSGPTREDAAKLVEKIAEIAKRIAEELKRGPEGKIR